MAAAAQRSGDIALILLAERFGGYPFIEIGWGEQDFYASVPTAADLDIGLAVRALFAPDNKSVVHVVGLPDTPRKVFTSADIVRVALSDAGFARMLSALNASVVLSGDPPDAAGSRSRPVWTEPVLSCERRLPHVQGLQSLGCGHACRGRLAGDAGA